MQALEQDLPAMGELLLQLGGDRGVVSGPLSEQELQHAQESIEAATLSVRHHRTCIISALCLLHSRMFTPLGRCM